MALLFMDSFVTASNDFVHKWNSTSSYQSLGNTTPSPHVSGGAWASFYGTTAAKTVTASSKLIVGCACWYGAGTVGELAFLGDTATTKHISVTRNTTTGFMEIRRGAYNGTLLATGSVAVPVGAWIYTEVSVTISDTVGEVHVRINGEGTDNVSFTGDTKNGGTSTNLDTFSLYAGGSTFLYICDVYICNDTGSAPNNTFLGEVAVRALSPNNNGNSSQLLGSDGNSTDNYLLVDEKPFSGSDYVGSPTTGQKDTYALADLPAGPTTVYGVQVNANMLKSDAGVGQSRLLVRTGGSDYGGTTRSLSTTAVTYSELYEQNPNTSSAWTTANVNGLEAGMEVM